MANDKGIGRPSGQTYQRSAAVVEEAVHPSRSRCGAGENPRYFSKTSAPICRSGRKKKSRAADTRAQGRLHRETSDEPGGEFEKSGEVERRVIKRDGGSRARHVSKKRGTWLRGTTQERSRCSSVPIDWSTRNCPRHIGSWSRRGVGRRGSANHV